MSELENFKDNAIRLGLCEEYKEKWQRLSTKRQAIDMISSCQGAQYFIAAKHENIAPTNEFILSEYSHYLNGRYTATIHTNAIYTSQWYIENKEEVKLSSLFNYFLDCECSIITEADSAHNLTFAGNSVINLVVGHNSIVYVNVYGSNVVINGDTSKVIIKNKQYNLK